MLPFPFFSFLYQLESEIDSGQGKKTNAVRSATKSGKRISLHSKYEIKNRKVAPTNDGELFYNHCNDSQQTLIL